jgi:prepilin-type N-terminal cleavage/methylation domain-containing protein
MRTQTRGFTMIEILVAISIVMILATITIVMVKGVDTKAKNTTVQTQIKTLADAVEAFKQETGKFPLAVPYDAWPTWDNAGADSFTLKMEWSANGNQKMKWTNYFGHTAGNPYPNFTWEGNSSQTDNTKPRPTNIQMLTFQLDQVPASAKILTQIRNQADQSQQVKFVPDATNKTDSWKIASDFCQIAHPLDTTANLRRKTFQPLDPWGTPLRFWTGDILKWAKLNAGSKTPWEDDVRTLLSEKLQKANWGYIIESAGPDRYFGWYGAQDIAVNQQRAEDNIYSTQ